MQKTECNQLDSMLAQMWSEHRDFLRRLLISLSRDIDLAEDLLQETYLRASRGLSTYRGGDSRAWLSAIARNTFYSHARGRYAMSEQRLSEEMGDGADALDSLPHLSLIELRQAVDALAPDLRIALIMKHYGGFTYREIAAHLECPAGTVQSRVWTAMQRLRDTLGASQKEPVRMKCEELRGLRMLDYLYGGLSAEEAARVEAHLAECTECREEIGQLQGVARALDSLEEEYKTTSIVELDEQGVGTGYVALSIPNPYETAQSTVEFGAGRRAEILHVFVQGEEVGFEAIPSEPDADQVKYRANLASPLEPGGRLDLRFVGREPSEPESYLGDGRWRMTGHLLLTEKSVTILAARLPCGARLERAEPKPDEVRAKSMTTLIWRRMMQPDEDFECTVEYTL